MVDFSLSDGFDWDEGNIEKNWYKHNVSFKECEEVFTNDPVFFYDEHHSQKEDRFVALGVNNNGRLLSIFFTVRHNKIRVISARDMSRKERNHYAKEKTA